MKRLEGLGPLPDHLGPGKTLVLHSGCAEPPYLSHLLAGNAADLRGTRVITFMPMGDSPYGEAGPASQLDVETFFPGKGLRAALTAGRARALRYPVSAMPVLFDRGELKADVVMLQVSTPDTSGTVSLGVSVDYMHAVLRQSPLVVAEINPRMPRTSGVSTLPVASIDWFVDATDPLQEMPLTTADETDARIAKNVAGLISDGSVIQLGIGSLQDCVLGQLGHLKHLGLHTGIVTDAIRPLIESGVIDNSTKRFMPGIGITTMAGGTQSFYDFLHNNRVLEFYPCSITHGAESLAKVEGLCAINSALQVDLAGNVNAETVGSRRIALPGGSADFSIAAVSVRGGASIVALRSTFGKDNSSNILRSLDPATPVAVRAPAVSFIVTEYGVAYLRGANPAQRAAAIAAIAHPAHREALLKAGNAA